MSIVFGIIAGIFVVSCGFLWLENRELRLMNSRQKEIIERLSEENDRLLKRLTL